MKYLRFSLISLLLTSFSVAVMAQKTKKKQSDVQVIKFDDEDEPEPDAKQYKGIIIKTSPVSFIAGRQMVEVEKQINGSMSVQFGVGATFAPVWEEYTTTLEEFNNDEGFCESTQWVQDICDDYSDPVYRKVKTGALLSASMRFFFEDDGYEGSYFAPVLRYSTTRVDALTASGSTANGWAYSSTETQAEKVTNFDIIGHYGYQRLYPKLTTEYFLGLGLRFRNNTRQDLGFDAAGVLQNGERIFKDKRFRMEVGLRIGFQL